MKKILLLLLVLPLAWMPGYVHAESFTLGSAPSDTGFSDAFGRVTSIQQMAVAFTTTVTANTFDVNLDSAVNGSPSDDAVIYIEGNSSGQPDGTVLGSSQVPASSLTGTCGATAYPTITTADLPAGTYWLVRGRSGSPDNTDNFLNCINHLSTTNTEQQSSGSWSGYGLDMVGTMVTSDSGGGGGGGTGTTTPPTVIDDPAEQIFDAMILFLLTMFGMIWFMRKH